MAETKRVVIEGFEDFRGDFDTGIYIVKPVVASVDGSTIENVIEDYCIDMSVGDEWVDDDFLDRRAVQNCFYRVRKKKQTPNFKYFRAIVDVYINNEDEIYNVVESEGF